MNEYEGDLICISESWNRPEFPLSELLKTENFENFKVFMNVKQRKERGGKPAVLVNTRKYHILELCPKLFTVTSSVEAVWILLKSKIKGIDTKIAVCSYYFSKNITLKEDLYEHIISSYNLIKAKYGENIHMILCADSNRLDLSPILDLSEHLTQVVKVPTRLNPDAILDTIITTLSLQYESPITKPPIGNDSEKGKPSDHLIVIWRPLTRYLSGPPKRYRSVTFRPLTQTGLSSFGSWLSVQTWNDVYKSESVDQKAETFQSMLISQFNKSFPEKVLRVREDDEPWYSEELKTLDRKKKREFMKHQKSDRWRKLNKEYKEKILEEKASYYKRMVKDLKYSNPRKWYSKVKRRLIPTNKCRRTRWSRYARPGPNDSRILC